MSQYITQYQVQYRDGVTNAWITVKDEDDNVIVRAHASKHFIEFIIMFIGIIQFKPYDIHISILI